MLLKCIWRLLRLWQFWISTWWFDWRNFSKTLNGLNGYLEKLFGMGSSKELLINNRETEIHLLILTTLHTLIDKYDKNYQQTWNEVFKLLNTPFRTVKKDEVEETINNDDTRSDEGFYSRIKLSFWLKNHLTL